jgi:hypothetical protein
MRTKILFYLLLLTISFSCDTKDNDTITGPTDEKTLLNINMAAIVSKPLTCTYLPTDRKPPQKQ